MSKIIHLWLDDLREPPHSFWKWCKTVEEALVILNKCREDNTQVGISFDHDLGENNLSGYELAKEIEASAFYGEAFPILTWTVHSQNPVGIIKINASMRQFEQRIEYY